MTTIFNFADDISVVANTLKEAVKTRKEELDYLDQEEKKELLIALKNTSRITKETVPDFVDLNNEFHVCEQDTQSTESGHEHMLETYGKDLEKAKLTHTNHIWTIVDCDNGLSYVCPGFHFVNRIGYLQTLKPWHCEDTTFLWS